MKAQVKAQFLEITASISLRRLWQILEVAIQQTFSRPNFWIEQFHFFAADVASLPSGLAITMNVADIADDLGFFSNKLTDDQIKALLLPVLAEMLQAQAQRLLEREIWLRSVHIQRLNRNPQETRLCQAYRLWLNQTPFYEPKPKLQKST